ncbi:BMP family ABC transporter substrate-binding protein [Virgibacillus sp. W0181]|uniref:BMP family ABC transporter substrate-binding protein n=1 Tax=Virgibacillus sp. W0181 TaxID=3391581 RepID=UPI003F45A8A7
MHKPILATLCCIMVLFSTSCTINEQDSDIHKVGMLVEGTAQDSAWDRKGYKGLVQIGNQYDADIYFRDEVQTEQDVIRVVDELVTNGVNLIFGHSDIYGKYFVTIASYYPDVQFIYFNGDYTKKNVTSLNFDSHAMGFFAGMMAGKMTTTNTVGVIAAYEWQPEIEGFFEGVKYENSNANVYLNFVNDWNDQTTAIKMYETMVKKNVDVFYPAGNVFSTEIIERASGTGLYAIGYVSDQSAIAKKTVLTSTVQHVDHLYLLAADMFQSGELKGDKLTFDFQEDAISLGEFSEDVPERFIDRINNAVQIYEKTGLLPNEQ